MYTITNINPLAQWGGDGGGGQVVVVGLGVEALVGDGGVAEGLREGFDGMQMSFFFSRRESHLLHVLGYTCPHPAALHHPRSSPHAY